MYYNNITNKQIKWKALRNFKHPSTTSFTLHC